MLQLLDQTLTTRAARAATAWINAFLASGEGEGPAAITQTIALEFYLDGVQFVCTDGQILVRTWLPAITEHGENAEWPSLDRTPIETVVVMDPEGFGLAFMKTLAKVTKDDAHAFDELAISIAQNDDEATLALGDEFMTKRVTLRACGQRIDLKVFDGEYPKWRRVELGLTDFERVDGMTVAPRMFALLGKLKNIGSIDLQFAGDEKRFSFEARGEALDTMARGVVCPMRRREGGV